MCHHMRPADALKGARFHFQDCTFDLRCKNIETTRQTCLDFHTSSTGIPAMMELGSSCAAELTVSLAPITSARSVSAHFTQTRREKR